MKIALVHDYLSQNGGAEKVLQAFQSIWPQAPTYTLFFDSQKLPQFKNAPIRTSFMQRLPLIRSRYQWYLPLMPTATESLDLSEFDVVLSSASAFAKGVITREDALHICYCHTPTRYLWSDTHSYVQELSMPRVVKSLLPILLSRLRVWDRQAADRVDYFIGNSETVRRRIRKYYGRDSRLLAPPVATERFTISDQPKNYFLTGGRLVAYKRYDLVVEACNQTGLPLIIFGTGPQAKYLRQIAKSNIQFVGAVSDQQQAELYAQAKAFIHPQVEDFGITPVESMAAGRPVIAYRAGGATETVIEGLSGEFFDEQSWEEIADRLIRFNESNYQPALIRAHAEHYSLPVFKERIKDLVEELWQQHGQSQ
ncbi:glycosyltransferase [Patescibacteria group bacterium]|nr:glycosyltransferase [Patescibacteria group bacterium]MBU1705534.1 glycosyltransferase [Patescibacteria group bacterium]